MHAMTIIRSLVLVKERDMGEQEAMVPLMGAWGMRVDSGAVVVEAIVCLGSGYV